MKNLQLIRASLSCDEMYPNAAVEHAVRSRVGYLHTKSDGLYSLQIYYLILFEPSRVRTTTLSNKKTLRHQIAHLERSRNTLMGYVDVFRHKIGDLAWLEHCRQTGCIRDSLVPMQSLPTTSKPKKPAHN